MRFLAVSVKLLQLIANDLYHTPLAITSEEVVQHTMLGILAILCLLMFLHMYIRYRSNMKHQRPRVQCVGEEA